MGDFSSALGAGDGRVGEARRVMGAGQVPARACSWTVSPSPPSGEKAGMRERGPRGTGRIPYSEATSERAMAVRTCCIVGLALLLWFPWAGDGATGTAVPAYARPATWADTLRWERAALKNAAVPTNQAADALVRIWQQEIGRASCRERV